MGEIQPAQAEVLLTVDDVCAWLKVAKHWVYDEVEARRLPHLRLGRRSLRFRRSEIQAYLNQHTYVSDGSPESKSAVGGGFDELESLD